MRLRECDFELLRELFNTNDRDEVRELMVEVLMIYPDYIKEEVDSVAEYLEEMGVEDIFNLRAEIKRDYIKQL